MRQPKSKEEDMLTTEQVKSNVIMEIIQSDREARKRFQTLSKAFRKHFNKEVDHVAWWWKLSERRRSELHAKWAGRR